jgi:hypothetical protein
MKTVLLAMVILAAHPIFAQETKHTTTKDLCREDLARWEAQLNQPSTSWSGVAKDVDSKALVPSASELNDCSKIDTARNRRGRGTGSVKLTAAV